jgi:hypothetical protein
MKLTTALVTLEQAATRGELTAAQVDVYVELRRQVRARRKRKWATVLAIVTGVAGTIAALAEILSWFVG